MLKELIINIYRSGSAFFGKTVFIAFYGNNWNHLAENANDYIEELKQSINGKFNNNSN